MSLSYKTPITAKDGTLIPIFSNNQAMFSKYSPQKDAENFASIPKDEPVQFFLVCGIGNGLHIKTLRQRFPKATILAIESSKENIEYLDNYFNLKKVIKELDFSFCVADEIEDFLPKKYIPLLHGDFSMLPLRSWANAHPLQMNKITNGVKSALDKITSDASTQAHFGKIWHKNILQNILILEKINKPLELNPNKKISEAFIAAAGPSLDKSIHLLKDVNFRQNHFFIATDTALPCLLKNNIIPDVTVTIDGQLASHKHFMQPLPKDMCIIADLCCNTSLVVHALKQGCDVMFFCGNHPLSLLFYSKILENKKGTIPFLDTSAGTVTITAVELALSLGFNKIKISGADFGYVHKKTYAKGTYFEDLFLSSSNRINPLIQKNISLLYRQPLTQINSNFATTSTLKTYSENFEKYCLSKGLIHLETEKNGIKSYSQPTEFNRTTKKIKFELVQNYEKEFIKWYISALENKNNEIIPTILPFAAWYKKKNKYKNDIFLFLKLAYYQSVMYTSSHGK